MTELYTALKNQENELRSLLHQAEQAYDPKKEKLILTKINNHCHYKTRSYDADSARQTTYVTRDKLSIIPDLAQNDYLAQLIPVLQKQLTQLQKYMKHADPRELSDVYDHLHPARKSLVKPLMVSDKDYADQWKSVTYQGNPKDFGDTEHYTENGIRVRSKSEIIIGDRLYRSGIPYRYEYPLSIDPTLTIYPDFTILNPRTRKVYYWEHFGRMGDPGYVDHTIVKLNHYSSVGILTGKNLIITMEGPTRPLSARTVMRIIEDCLV